MDRVLTFSGLNSLDRKGEPKSGLFVRYGDSIHLQADFSDISFTKELFFEDSSGADSDNGPRSVNTLDSSVILDYMVRYGDPDGPTSARVISFGVTYDFVDFATIGEYDPLHLLFWKILIKVF